MMACYVPFNSRNLDISFFAFRPTVVDVEDLIQAFKQISCYTESLGCVHSSIFKSIHGNLIIWYGAWMKRSDENKQLLIATLLSLFTRVTSMAMLSDYGFFSAYAGESKDGSPAAKFFTGDTICFSSARVCGDYCNQYNNDHNTISYAGLAIFKDRFLKMSGAKSGVCFRCQTETKTETEIETGPPILSLVVWQSLQSCYTFLLTSPDCRRPALDDLALDIKYDVFRVVYVSGEPVDMVELPLYTKKSVNQVQLIKNEDEGDC
ncbi:uncharacterized protein LOC127249467 [Andrographis paniculata]|uniref:uncharacterized protein LOC127249467 n=1 Tax=Andrographis paniculata TaxID=175694 RepID=UPI0021E8E821|nr:uncharacterized protein LOC127249467 [Andrographis paniculata]